MSAKLKTAVLGATGYSGVELTRLLLRHPRLDKPVLLCRENGSSGAVDLADAFPLFLETEAILCSRSRGLG